MAPATGDSCLILPELSEEPPAIHHLRAATLMTKGKKNLSTDSHPPVIEGGPIVLTFLNCTLVKAQRFPVASHTLASEKPQVGKEKCTCSSSGSRK